jgi:uncharacterized protein
MLRAMRSEHAFSILTREIGPSGTEVEFEIPDAWIDAEIGDSGVAGARPGRLVAGVSPSSPGYWIRGRISVHLAATCVRCLRPAPVDIDIPFKVHMQPGPVAPRDDGEGVGEDGNLGIAHYEGEEIVLDSLVRESIVLALPMNPHCPVECSIDDLYREDD